MANLSDFIEEHLKRLLALSSRGYIEIQRRELSRKFTCVPSQINYVLSSRFTLERGYLVESRRGGRGFIRIYRIDPMQFRSWDGILQKIAGVEFEPAKAVQFLKRGCEERIVSRREAQIVEALLRDDHYAGLIAGRQELRELQKKLFKAALEAILKGNH
ncbi:MAG: CtsR family transcriptional regulator [Bacillota bacterium]